MLINKMLYTILLHFSIAVHHLPDYILRTFLFGQLGYFNLLNGDNCKATSDIVDPLVVKMTKNVQKLMHEHYFLLGGRCNIDKGWLTGQTEVRLCLHSNPVEMWKRSDRQQSYQIKCSTMDLRYKDVCLCPTCFF